ncbi:DUF881 domain-containing protein [uncultured Jatrophihabitans sp.]|uniref:DUF881 domain-containing protein n=1 Tax=uncultured Jatrophihabitans sp. TaxID=1610747 RepID=UPI0035CAB422
MPADSPVPPSLRSTNRESAQLLIDLVNDTLDPGYAAAAAQHGPDGARRSWDRPAVALGCLLIGFVLVVAYDHTHRSAPETQQVHDSLVQRVRAAQARANTLAGQLGQAERSLSSEQNRVLPSSGAAARARLSGQVAAGELAVHGPGLTVTLRGPKAAKTTASNGRVGSDSLAATSVLTDRDVRSVVNELWADGAEAIAVNGVRLTPTSAIRFAGEAVLVDFQPITAPYTIAAVGDADALSTNFAQSAVASRYQTLVSADGIGFSVDTRSRIELRAGVPGTLRYAVPITPKPTPAPTSTRR